jgi:hypothetical protein
MAEFALLLIGYHILGLVILGQMGGGREQSLVHSCPLLFLSIFCLSLFRGWGRVSDGEEEEGLEGM